MARCPTCHRRLLGATCATHGTVSVPTATTALALDVVPVWSQPLTRLVGRGGFASVWEISGGGVLKVAHASHDLARARMRREADALAAVGAPAVPRLLDQGVLDDGRAWIAMEHVAGTPLGDVLATGPLRIDQAISIGDAILASLARVHAAGFVHRDLKPDNLISAKGAITLLDLGLARRLPDDPDDPTRAGVQVGSLEYMAPEQLRDAAAAGTCADIYAFGCVLYELCAGRPPFVGDASGLERAHAALRPPPLAALATVPPPLEALVHDCLAKLPERRPASVTELRTRLVALRDATPSLQRVQHSGSLIREGKQPIVLLWAELPKVDRTLLGMLAARKITVISQRGRRVLGGVIGADHADPAGAAIAAARDLAAAGARVALHLDAYVVTTGRSGATIDGVTEDWLPGSAWTGIVVTRALAAVIQTPTRPCELPGFVMLGEPAQAVELFGRDGLVTELATDAAVALAKQGPALALLVGEPGIGKTSIARALLPQLRDLGARVVAGDVPPPGAGKPSHAALAELVESPGVRAIGDALRRAAREQPLAIVVDNAHLAEPDLLDALECATLGGEPLALWVLVIATPRLEQRRPGFGARAERHRRDVVPPLDEEPAVALTTALLRPAEYPPLRALRQIASIARGNPMHLTTLVREIHDRGAIRTRPNGEHFLDTTALDALPTIALGPWLAARELAHLSPELAGLARVCAVLGDEIDRAELRAVVESVERRGGATTTLDVDVGLRELEATGIVTGTSFKQALVAEGIYATTHEDERRAIHAAALEYWQREGAHPQRIARHAEAVGKKSIAARAYAQLGIEAERAHRALDADQMFQGALRNSEARDALHVRALIGRARARTRAQRLTDALADLDEAVTIAREIGDVGLEVEALLDQATALDWTQDFAASKAAALRASELAGAQPAVRFAVARSAFRDEDRARAETELAATMREAREAGNVALEIDAGLVLAGAQVELGKLAEAEAVLARVIALCEASGDRFHLGAAYNNRTALWSARGDIERVDRDLLDVIQLAREAGQAFVERAATYNLAEDRLWQGDLDEAVRLARRSLALQRGHGEGSTRLDEMLLARILAARGDREELRGVLAQLATYDLDADERKFFAVLDAIATAGALEAALAGTEGLATPHRLELLHLARPLEGARLAEAKSLATGDAIWSKRVDAF